MPNNNSIFNAVMSGAGGASQDRWLTVQSSGQYDTFTGLVVAIATAVDAQIPPTSIDIGKRNLMQSIAQGVFAGRYPVQGQDYTDVAEAITALYTSMGAQLLPEAPFNSNDTQTEWYVNQATGSNAGTGRIDSPLKDTEELARRIFPNNTRLMMKVDTTIHIASGTYGYAFFGAGNANAGDGAGGTAASRVLRIIAAQDVVIMPPLVLAVNPSPPTRGQIGIPSGTFTYRKRIRFNSGPSAGAVGYSTGLNGNPQNTFLSGLVIPQFAGFHVFSGATIGDVVQEETPTVLIRRAEFNAGPYARIVIENAKIIRATVNGVCSESPSGDSGGNVLFSACDAAGGFSIWQCNSGGACLFACRITNATVFQGFGWLFWGCVNQGLMGIANGSIASYGFMIDGGILITNVEANFEFKSNQGASRFTAEQSYNGSGTIEVQNGGNTFGIGACINVMAGGEFVNAGRGSGSWLGQSEIWGSSTPYAIGFFCAPGGHMYQDPVNATGDEFLACWNIPSTINMRIGKTDYSYSKNARPDPDNNCGLIAARYI